MIETDRLIAATPSSSQEEIQERALRPKQLEEYIGQENPPLLYLEGALKKKWHRFWVFPHVDKTLIIYLNPSLILNILLRPITLFKLQNHYKI